MRFLKIEITNKIQTQNRNFGNKTYKMLKIFKQMLQNGIYRLIFMFSVLLLPFDTIQWIL